MSGTDTTRTGFDALESPINEIPWGRNLPAVACYSHPDTLPYVRDTKGERRERRAVARLAKKKWRLAALAGAAGIFASQLPADAKPRLAEPGCIKVVVKKGDTVWAIGKRSGVTLDVIANLNPHVPNLNVIEVGDEIAVSCPGFKPTPADPNLPPPVIVLSNEVQRKTGEPWEGMAPWPGFNKWLPGDGTNSVASQAAVLRALFKHGARGDKLIHLAAVTEGESNRRIGAVGDQELADATWDHSCSPFQIRTQKAAKGTGSARDAEVVCTLDGGAWAAIQIYDAAAKRGAHPMSPWTAWRVGNAKSFIDPYRELAQRMGMDG